MSGRRWLVVTGAMLVGLSAAACATLPTSGSINLRQLQGPSGSGQIGVQVMPVPPGPSWRPDDIVRGFLLANASYDPGHAVARKYLTSGKKGYSSKWRPGWAATIVAAPRVKTLQPPSKIVTGGQRSRPDVVVVTGKRVETLQTAGTYQAGSVVVEPANQYKFTFTLVQVAGQWRIDSITVNNSPAPRSLLLMSQADFERFYQPRNLYFYPAGDSQGAHTLVPDPVFIPQQAGNLGIPGLVNTLINPPTSASWLYGAATTAFPRGTKLIRAQVSGGITAVVDLGGAAAEASRAQVQRMAAQLWWSLGPKSTPYPAQASNPISQVVLQINGRTVQEQVPSPYSNWVPRGSAGPLYYQVPGGAEPGELVMRRSPAQSVPVQLPDGLPGGQFDKLAASREPAGSSVLAGCSGKTLDLIPQSRAGETVTKHLPTPCTSLSWDVHGNLWIAATSQIFEMRGVGAGPPPRPALDAVFVGLGPDLANPDFRTLKVAPDGVRAALIIHNGSSVRIEVAAISTSNDTTYLAQTSRNQMLRVGSDVTNPVALTWLDPDHLLVLGQSGPGRTQLFEVPLNGGESTPITTPHGVTSVAATWPESQTAARVIIAIAPTRTSPGKIEQSITQLPNPTWQPLVRDGVTPIFPG